MKSTLLILTVACVLTACPNGGLKPSPETAPKAQLVQDLAMFASGTTLKRDELDQALGDIQSGKLSLERYVDDLLRKPIGARFAKELIVSANETRKDKHPLSSNHILKADKSGQAPIYYLRKKCDAKDAVKVLPWWADDTNAANEVLVCPDSYRPDVRGDSAGRTCGASMLAPSEEDICGCGPRLVYCTKDREQWSDIQDDVEKEVFDTTAYVVNEDRPIEDLFTMNESVRTRNAEMLYRRARILAGEPESIVPIADFPKGDKGKLVPRHEQTPGQMAGILSTPAMMFSSDALRGVMRNVFDYMFCSGVSSSHVTTQGILALDVVDLRVGDGWKQLASMPVCTDCHARLDYGMQFFWGWPSSTMGTDFNPKNARSGDGPFYVHDIKDERGTGELSPRGFGKLATTQPEFGKCMTRKVVDHVFNGSATAADFDAVFASYESTHKVKQMLRTAMLRYAESNKDGRPPSPPAVAELLKRASAPGGAGDESVPVTKELRALMDDQCMNCHDKGDAVEFTADAYPRKAYVAMMDKVGFGSMPQTAKGFDDVERRTFLAALAPLAFADEKERAQALEHFGNGLRALSVHRFRTAMLNVHARAGQGGKAFRPASIEGDIQQSLASYTPGVALSAAATAIKSCRTPNKDGKALEGADFQACVERATSPGGVIVGAVTDP